MGKGQIGRKNGVRTRDVWSDCVTCPVPPENPYFSSRVLILFTRTFICIIDCHPGREGMHFGVRLKVENNGNHWEHEIAYSCPHKKYPVEYTWSIYCLMWQYIHRLRDNSCPICDGNVYSENCRIFYIWLRASYQWRCDTSSISPALVLLLSGKRRAR